MLKRVQSFSVLDVPSAGEAAVGSVMTVGTNGHVYIGYSDPARVAHFDQDGKRMQVWCPEDSEYEEDGAVFQLLLAPLDIGSSVALMCCLDAVTPLNVWPRGISRICAEYATEDVLLIYQDCDLKLWYQNNQKMEIHPASRMLKQPTGGIACGFDRKDRLYIASGRELTIEVFDHSLAPLQRWSFPFPKDADPKQAVLSMAIDNCNDRLYLTHHEFSLVQCFDLGGNLVHSWAKPQPNASAITVDRMGRIYLTRYKGVEIVSDRGEFMSMHLEKLYIHSVHVSTNDRLYILHDGRVLVFDVYEEE